MTFKGTYPKSENENFWVENSIGVPHPYCITPKHLEWSNSMVLDVPGAEQRSREAHPGNPGKWAVCDICRKLVNKRMQPGILTYEQHEQALVIGCKGELESPELKAYLLAIKEEAEKNGYVGFAFVDRREE